MPASFSPEGRIISGLQELGCSARSFVEIARGLDIRISQGVFSECLNDRSHLDNTTGEQLLNLLTELKAVRDRYQDIPIDWVRTGRIVSLIVTLRVARIQEELSLVEGVHDER